MVRVFPLSMRISSRSPPSSRGGQSTLITSSDISFTELTSPKYSSTSSHADLRHKSENSQCAKSKSGITFCKHSARVWWFYSGGTEGTLDGRAYTVLLYAVRRASLWCKKRLAASVDAYNYRSFPLETTHATNNTQHKIASGKKFSSNISNAAFSPCKFYNTCINRCQISSN